jgi:RNA polymerase sigma factor (sigma-70 family)
MNPINWNETYTNISPKLLGICRRYIKDVATAEDIVQDSFMVAIQKENSLKDSNALNGWLSRIVINMAIHHLKETKKIIFSTSENFEVIDTSTTMNTFELNNKSKLLASDLDRNDVLEAIDGLPEHHKSVFNMYVIDQFSHNEIAKTLEISVGTSKSHLSRARKSIQTFLLEKIKDQPIDGDKKRRMAFWLFLGFGNSMFANFYQSRFEGFEIATKNPFSFTPKNVTFPNQFIGLSKVVSLSKIAFVAIPFISVLSIGLYFYTTKSDKNNLPKNETKITIETKIDTLKKNSEITQFDSITSEKVRVKEISQVKKERKNQNITSKKEEILPKKDSLSETPKVIVIKKQIIKRDTIYVTK